MQWNWSGRTLRSGQGESRVDEETALLPISRLVLTILSGRIGTRIIRDTLAPISIQVIPIEIAAGGRSTPTYALRPELSKLAMPALLIWGEKESFGPPSVAAEMARRMPDDYVDIVSDAGHLAWLDQPEKVVASISNFLQR